MLLTYSRRPGFWLALLWKEVCQLRSITCSLAVGLICLQAILMLICILGPEEMRPDTALFQWIAAGAGTCVYLIAAPAMVIGHERQTSTWTWQSSLPQSWWHSLVAKCSATLLVGLLLVTCLLILPTITLSLYANLLGDGEGYSRDVAYSLCVAGLIGLEIAAASALGSLLFRETLNGIIVASCLVVGLHSAVYFSLLNYHTSLSPEANARWLDSFSYANWLQLFAIPPGLATAAIATYKWRWGAGQFSSLSLLPSKAIAGPRVRSLEPRSKQPSMWKSQFALAIRAFLPLRLGAVAVGVAFTWAIPDNGVVIFWGGLACFLIGLTTFSGDQSKRLDFLADRGASPGVVFRTRLAAAGVFLTPTFLTLLSWALFTVDSEAEATATIAAFIAITCLAIYCSITFRTATTAFAVAALTLGIASTLLALALGVVFRPQLGALTLGLAVYEYTGRLMLIIAAVVTPTVILVATYRNVRPWIVRGDTTHTGWYPVVCLVALFLPVFLGSTFAFLAYPRTSQARIDTIIAQADNLVSSPGFSQSTIDALLVPDKADAMPDLGKLSIAKQLKQVREGNIENGFATSGRGLLHNYYPPIRWALERDLVRRYGNLPAK